jgi:glycosyltransferase involved in cell wall biosynthesis
MYPQLSQTFVRDEIHALRASGMIVDVVSLRPTVTSAEERNWAGAYEVLRTPPILECLKDHVWLLSHHLRSYARFWKELAHIRERARVSARCLPTLARALRGGGHVDRCHAHFAWEAASIAAYLAALTGSAASVTAHAKDIYIPSPMLARRLSRLDLVVTVCHFNVGVLNRLHVPDERISVVPCGVAVPTDIPRGAAEVDIVAVGRLIAKKGFADLLEAVARLRPDWPGVSVEIIGAGPERKVLQDLIEELNLEQNVRLLGALTHAATLDRIGHGAVFCLPARVCADGDSDAVPVVIREAMARARVVVSTRVAGIPEVVTEDTGWVVDPGDIRALTQALSVALGDGQLRAGRGRAARCRCESEWTFTHQVTRLQTAFTGGGRVRTA